MNILKRIEVILMDVDLEYVYLQSEYRKLNEGKENLFPSEWYNIKEYELKKKILQECISNNINIKDSHYYYQFRMKALN